MTSPQILLLFVLMGGLIAYLGDWLGRKMGKKRLRIAGLRPRHTATVFTVGMGMLIPVATTYGLITNSASVRQWLTEGPQLARERDLLEKQIEASSIEAKKLKDEADAQRQRIISVQKSRKDAENDRDTAFEQRDTARTQAGESVRKLAMAAVRERRVALRVGQLTRREASLSRSVADKSHQLADREQQLSSSRAESDRLLKETEGLKQNSIQLAQQIQTLEGQAEEQRQRADRARKEADTAEKETQRLYDRILDLRLTMMQMEGNLAGATQGIEAVRTSDVIFRKDEELARLPVPGGLDDASARAKIEQVVKAADLAARERGVKPDEEGRAASMDSRMRRLPDGTFIRISVEDQVSAFATEMGKTNEDLLIIASSFYNYFSKDDTFVPIQINIYHNKKVYDSGDKVAQIVIDGSLAEGEIWDAVLRFLRSDVRSAAEASGLIPVHGRETSLGEITYAQMTSLVRQIKNRGGPTKVEALAAKKTLSAEPLALKFRTSNP